jgi:hypothetical protein
MVYTTGGCVYFAEDQFVLATLEGDVLSTAAASMTLRVTPE